MTTPAPTSEAGASGLDTEFTRGLGLFDSTMVVVGSMIGSGIFIVSADIARLVGSPGWLLMAWIVTGALTLAAALSYGELAAMMPRAGGQYVYLREAFSPLCGFLYGWTLFLVIQTGTIAAVGVAFARCLGEFGATTAFAGSLQGTTRTLPLLVYLERETDVDAAVALSLVLVVVAVVVIALTRPRGSEGLS